MRIIKVKDYEEMSIRAAAFVAAQLTIKPESVLGLATGSTPVGTYQQLIKQYNEGLISFKDSSVFNLDEYLPIEKSNSQSYHYFMRENLFDHIDIKDENTYIPDGASKDVEKTVKAYEEDIKRVGPIDLQLLGIGINGHIGFNEPDIVFESDTHIADLTENTIEANCRFFENEDMVPKQALTMGIKTIMSSKKILLLASGKSKALAIKEMIYGKIDPKVPASVLQLHNDVIVIVDEEAAKYLY